MTGRPVALRSMLIVLVLSGCSTLRTQNSGPPPATTESSTPSAETSLSQQRTGIRKSLAIPEPMPRALTFSLLRAREQSRLRIHFLPIGTGSCQIVECPGPNATPMLIDCGSTGLGDFDEAMVRDYIQDIVKDGQINVVVSHSDDDHANLIPRILDPDQVRSLWIGDKEKNYKAPFRAWTREFKRIADQSGAFFSGNLDENWINDGDAVADLQCGTANTFVLGVNSGRNPNANSLMLAIEYGTFNAIFTGDATNDSEAAAIENYPGALRTTVLSASHHGAETEGSNSVEWAEATRPAYVIYTAGYRSNFRHPRCNSLAVYREAGELAQVPRHSLQCGTERGWSTRASSLGEYSTHASGLIVVSTGRNGVDMSISCSKGTCE